MGKKKKLQPPQNPNPARVTRSSQILDEKEVTKTTEVVLDATASPKITIWDLCKMSREEAQICRENMESESIPTVSAASTPISVRSEKLSSFSSPVGYVSTLPCSAFSIWGVMDNKNVEETSGILKDSSGQKMDSSLKSEAPVKVCLNSVEKTTESSLECEPPVKIWPESASELKPVHEIGNNCADVSRSGNVRECSMTAAGIVAATRVSVGPEVSQFGPGLNDELDQQEFATVGPSPSVGSTLWAANEVITGNLDLRNGMVDSMATGQKKSPGMCESGPCVESPNAINNNQKTVSETVAGFNDRAGPADQAKAQNDQANIGSERGVLDNLRFGSIDPIKLRQPTFQFVCDPNLKFGPNGVDVDPIFGTKFWNHELFAQLTKGLEVEESETRLFYEPPEKEEGEAIVNLNGHFMTKSIKAHRFQLYGYFVGDAIPFQTVKENLIKMWHKFGLKSINKKVGGFYFFTFDHDDGMLKVLERNPWLVKNVPLVLQLWQPDTILSKPDLDKVPIWVTLKDLPLCLWNGGNIGQIVSRVGKPLMLDKATYERCETKKGPLSFARVLVEANASCGLPNRVKVRFPSLNDLPGKIGYLELSYKWKPPLCGKCNVFGHEEASHEVAKKPVDIGSKGKNVVDQPVIKPVLKKPIVQDDGFTIITRKKSKVKWAPLDKRDVDRLMNGPKTKGAGPSFTRNVAGLNNNMADQVGHAKPSEKAAGLTSGGVTEVGSAVSSGPTENPVAATVYVKKGVGQASVFNRDNFPHLGGGNLGLDEVGRPYSPILEPVIQQQDPKRAGMGQSCGTGYFDTSVGLRASPSLSTKNTFGVLRDEVENFDTKNGLWDHEVEVVKKFSDSCASPPDGIYEAWNDNMKKFYQELTKNGINSIGKSVDEEAEVESETDETARFMKSDL